MDADITYLKTTNNNPAPSQVKKKWSQGSVLGSVEEDEFEPPLPPTDRGRRKSWHVSKERKRRKSLAPPVTRTKRHSWWTILVPDQLMPSRSVHAIFSFFFKSIFILFYFFQYYSLICFAL
ncbi:hypothetical protein O3M35_010575 [Rhynocoris fuscipes]|uniref:Uncharacterized protein n=1 Tax=Rhynocoris fuscipes TaxID=488301 RepID=A0AAW1D6I1_9HEMI